MPGFLSAGLHVSPVLCEARLHGFAFAPPQTLRWCSLGTLPLSPHLSHSSLCSSLQGRPFPRGAGQRGGRWDVLQQGKPLTQRGLDAPQILPSDASAGCVDWIFCFFFFFAEKNMGVEQEWYQDLQDEGKAWGEASLKRQRSDTSVFVGFTNDLLREWHIRDHKTPLLIYSASQKKSLFFSKASFLAVIYMAVNMDFGKRHNRDTDHLNTQSVMAMGQGEEYW